MIRIIYTYFLILIFISCSTKKDIIYLQEIEKIQSFQYDYSNHKVKPDDILSINVYSEVSEAVSQFNVKSEGVSSNIELLKISGYLVDNSGFINFPVLGKINLLDKTIVEAEDVIYNELLDRGYLRNHSVHMKLLNARYTILGEVNSPGTYEYLENNMNILRAIGQAGDLTIQADRKNIRLIRNIDDTNKVYLFDITNPRLIKSDIFQIQSGDIIIVNPNSSRVKNAGIIENPGTLVSTLSFILTTILLITNR